MDLYFRNITIDYTKVSASLTNFPIYVSIVLGSGVASSTGFDVHFQNLSGTELAFEMTSWNNSTKTWQGWIKVDSISNTVNTVIKVLYGNSSITTDQSSTSTWDSNYKTVHHLNDTSGAKDSTSNGLNLVTGVGTITYGQSGKPDRAIGINNSDLRSTSGTTVTDFTGAFTFSAWFNYSSAQPYAGFMGNLEDNTANGWTMELNGGVPNIWLNNTIINGPSVSTGTWYYMVVTRDVSGNVTIYYNGSSVATGSVSGSISTGRKYIIGGWGNTSYTWVGTLDTTI